jgi:hypothetical protein
LIKRFTFGELNAFFDTKKSTVDNKSIKIREMLDMNRMTNFEYMTKVRKDSHPLYNTVMVDGFFVHISDIPEEYQKMVREAREKGQDISFNTK